MEPHWDIEAEGELLPLEGETPLARVRCQIWIIPPQEQLPGKWGGRLEVLNDFGLRAADFQFRLKLDDGRTALCFVDLDLDAGRGILDGNGPPPSAGANASPARAS